jgi:protein SCO1/2
VSRAVLLVTAALGLGSLAYAALGSGRSPESSSSLPYYATADLTPHWSSVTHRVRPFELLTQSGTPLRETDLDGRIHVASFIFTRCPNLCPMLVTRLRRVQEAAREWPDVRLVSYSVTPALDTPAVLAAFGQTHHIDAERWWLTTGDRATITRLARESYFADDARTTAGGPSDALLHTENVVLVDAERRLRGVYNGTLAFEIERLLEDIRTLRKEGRHPQRLTGR